MLEMYDSEPDPGFTIELDCGGVCFVGVAGATVVYRVKKVTLVIISAMIYVDRDGAAPAALVVERVAAWAVARLEFVETDDEEEDSEYGPNVISGSWTGFGCEGEELEDLVSVVIVVLVYPRGTYLLVISFCSLTRLRTLTFHDAEPGV